MKIKKILIFIVTIFVAICLVGCGEATTGKAVASNIDKKTARLDSVITALDELNYDDIVIEGISPLSDSTYNITDISKVRNTKWYSVGNGSSYKTQNVSKPSEPNAKFVSGNNGNKIDINKEYDRNYISNNCPNCEPNPINNKNNYAKNNTSKVTNNGTNYSVNRTSNYSPKYVNNVSDSFTRNGLDKYLNQVESCYDKCADCISCNAEINNQKSMLKQNIDECKILSSKLKDGTIKLSDEEINRCNDCLNELSNCTKRLGSTKQNLMLKEKDILKLKQNFSKNMTDIESAYEKLLTALESRLTYLQDCNNSICSLCDIINKTNVDMNAAEKNRSDESDILIENQKLNEEQRNQEDTYLNGSTPIVKNKMRKENTTAKKMRTLENAAKTNKTNTKKANDVNSTNQNTKKNTNSQSRKTPKRYRRNLVETPEIVNSRTNSQNQNNSNIQNNSFENRQNTQRNNQNYTNNTMPNINQNVENPNPMNYDNPNYGYNGYGYNGNRPYPPRNIDTYRNIVKNIDTYSPNYLPGNGINGNYNNGILQNNSNMTNESTQNIENKTDNQTVIPAKDNNKIDVKNNQNYMENNTENNLQQQNQNIVQSTENTDNNTTMQSENNVQNTQNNSTTMQTQNDVYTGTIIDEKF